MMLFIVLSPLTLPSISKFLCHCLTVYLFMLADRLLSAM